MTHIALLRGINVGGHARLPMRDLVEIFQGAGAKDVRTYIQSGNVLFSAANPEAVTAEVTRQIAARFGYPGRIILRSAEEFCAVVAANPFALSGAGEDSLHISFLADYPTQAVISSLDPNRSPGDRFTIVNREIYLHLPNGMGRTKLTSAFFDAGLKTTGTARNWRSVRAILALAESA